jgi:hypothetical protein
MKEPQILEQMSHGRLPRKIEVNIAQMQTCIKKLMQHDENLAIPESPEVSLNSSKVSIGDETSQNEHLAKSPFSPLPQLLKVHSGSLSWGSTTCPQGLVSQT